MNPILANMAARRSIRSFLPDTPPPYQLREILEAGRMAPSGGNKQACHFLVIQSPDILAELSQRAVAAFAQMEASPDTYESLASSIRKAKQGAYDFLYGAPVLVLVANLIYHGNAMADSACALENMMLAAAGFGLGSCWINQIRWLRDEPSIRSYLLSLGMAPEETIYGGVALGLPKQRPVMPLARPGNRITYL